jgi:hypothetical protein
LQDSYSHCFIAGSWGAQEILRKNFENGWVPAAIGSRRAAMAPGPRPVPPQGGVAFRLDASVVPQGRALFTGRCRRRAARCWLGAPAAEGSPPLPSGTIVDRAPAGRADPDRSRRPGRHHAGATTPPCPRPPGAAPADGRYRPAHSDSDGPVPGAFSPSQSGVPDDLGSVRAADGQLGGQQNLGDAEVTAAGPTGRDGDPVVADTADGAGSGRGRAGAKHQDTTGRASPRPAGSLAPGPTPQEHHHRQFDPFGRPLRTAPVFRQRSIRVARQWVWAALSCSCGRRQRPSRADTPTPWAGPDPVGRRTRQRSA